MSSEFRVFSATIITAGLLLGWVVAKGGRERGGVYLGSLINPNGRRQKTVKISKGFIYDYSFIINI